MNQKGIDYLRNTLVIMAISADNSKKKEFVSFLKTCEDETIINLFKNVVNEKSLGDKYLKMLD